MMYVKANGRRYPWLNVICICSENITIKPWRKLFFDEIPDMEKSSLVMTKVWSSQQIAVLWFTIIIFLNLIATSKVSPKFNFAFMTQNHALNYNRQSVSFFCKNFNIKELFKSKISLLRWKEIPSRSKAKLFMFLHVTFLW